MWGGVLPLTWEDDTMGRPFTPSVEVSKKGDGRLPSVHKLSKTVQRAFRERRAYILWQQSTSSPPKWARAHASPPPSPSPIEGEGKKTSVQVLSGVGLCGETDCDSLPTLRHCAKYDGAPLPALLHALPPERDLDSM